MSKPDDQCKEAKPERQIARSEAQANFWGTASDPFLHLFLDGVLKDALNDDDSEESDECV